jgi:3-oxoadipate enol-lactonase / 4-carboxymuconolactone decarboxylase
MPDNRHRERRPAAIRGSARRCARTNRGKDLDVPFVTRDGARLYWRSDGDPARPALLLGNSLGAEHALWAPLVPSLQRHFRVLRFDARGHGGSEAPPGEYTIEMLAGDALAVADAAGAARFHYMGISIGGMVGMWLGAHAADRVDRLVLCNTAAKLPREIWADRIAAVRAGGMAAIADAVLARWFTTRFLERADENLASIRAAFVAVDPVGYVGCCAAIRDMDLAPHLGAIRAPTLVTTGAHDLASPKELGKGIAAAIPGARVVELPFAHIPVIEAPGLLAHTVLDFLAAPPVTTERDRYDVGLCRRKAVLGERHVDERLKQVTPFNAEFHDLITRYAWGEIWSRNVLDDRMRRMLVLAMLVALGRWDEFQMHVRTGLAAELSEAELKEVLLLAAIYCGVPAANTGFHKAAELLRDAP